MVASLVKDWQLCQPGKMKTFLLLCLFVSPAMAEELSTGFDVGNDFVATYLSGEVTVSCRDNGQSDFASFRCVGEVLDPAEFVRFKGPKVSADKVILSALREDGSVREKSESYDAEKGISKGRFNLWISTLFQRPLLKFGRNVVDYSLTKSGKTVKAGQFTAQVSAGPERSCQRRHYFSNNLNDCRGSQMMCSQYFRDEDYCQNR